MNYYAVIDTNVLVAALIRKESVPGLVVRHALEGKIIPLVNAEILEHYRIERVNFFHLYSYEAPNMFLSIFLFLK